MNMDIDWIVTLWSALVVLVATTVHGITGFGTGQIMMGVLPFFRDAGSASIVVTIVIFITNLRVLKINPCLIFSHGRSGG